MNGKRVMKTKQPVALVALLVLLCCTVAGTLAYLVDSTDPVTNTFTPAHVSTAVDETFENGVKSDVKIQNTGDIDAYIRATVVVNWASDSETEKNVVSGIVPKEGTDYTIDWTMVNWVKVGDYYYYTQKVAAKGETKQLFTDCKLKEGVTPPSGYHLQVTILADGIQADGVGVASDGKTTTPMEDAWGVDPSALTNG